MRLPFAPRRHEVIPRPLPPMHVCDKHRSALGKFLYTLQSGLDLLLCGHCAMQYGGALMALKARVAEVQ